MVFSIPTFATVGDPYDKPKKLKDERKFTDKPFNPNYTGKDGKLPDALFTRQFLSINEGDPYIDPITRERREKREAMAKARAHEDRPVFRYTNPTSKRTGLGDYHGTIDNKPIVHETDYIVPRKGEAPPAKHHELRGFYTNPPKKGTFGFNSLSMSNIGLNYVADFYDAPREANKRYQELSKKLMKGTPFRAACRLGYTFDEMMGSGVSAVYTMTRPMAPRKAKPAVEAVDKKDAPPPWRPAGQPKFAPLEYREDPYDGYDPRVGKRKPDKNKDSDRSSWRPSGATNSSWYTKSIAFARL